MRACIPKASERAGDSSLDGRPLSLSLSLLVHNGQIVLKVSPTAEEPVIPRAKSSGVSLRQFQTPDGDELILFLPE